MRIKVHIIRPVIISIVIVCIAFQGLAQENKDLQNTIHLLDYLSKDYSMAVSDGKVVDDAEYAEMMEFSSKILSLAEDIKLPSEAEKRILSKLDTLKTLVLQKAAEQKIKALTENVKWNIIESTGYQVAPLTWPEQANGKRLYQQSCVQCHGPKGAGNGALADGLRPRPTNFLDGSAMAELSPFGAYNTIKLGVEGTAMRAFDEITDEEAWDLAFYLKSLQFRKQQKDSSALQKKFNEAYQETSLKEVATLTDNELIGKLGADLVGARKLKALRLLSPPEGLAKSSLDLARHYLQQSIASYDKGNRDDARQNALAAYLEGIEPVEVRLKANDPGFTAQLEQHMMAVRQAIEQEKGSGELKVRINEALSAINRAETMMADDKLNYWLSFFLSVSIMLREGLEAFLIIALILALLRNTPNSRKAVPYIHAGWVSAILMGVAGWFFSDWIIGIGGQDREVMEGTISLVAVIVLAFVGFWLHNHSHSKKWKVFIEKKVGTQIKTANMMGLAIFSFMVVFREAFESVLFLQAINLETQPASRSSIGFGVLTAFVLIALFAILFIKYSKKIPVRQLFRYSTWVIALLALILIGKGIHSIQEAGWLSITSSPIPLRIEWLGIFPTLETILSQIMLLAIILILYYWSNYRNRLKFS